MINITSIQGIIFDLDGTLYKMRWFIKPLLSIKVFPHCLRLPRFLKIREKFAGLDLLTRENLFEAICKEIALKENITSKEINSWIMESFYPGFVDVMKFQRSGRPGVNTFLCNLKNAGLQLGVLSDYDFVVPRLKNLKIDSTHFSVTTSCEASGALKPSPRPFLQIAQLWNILPENILVIGDRNDTDGVAAQNAGMPFLRICESNQGKSDSYSWAQIKEYLSSITNKTHSS